MQGVFVYFHNPPNSDTGHRIFKVCTWSFNTCVYTWGQGTLLVNQHIISDLEKNKVSLMPRWVLNLRPWDLRYRALSTEPTCNPASFLKSSQSDHQVILGWLMEYILIWVYFTIQMMVVCLIWLQQMYFNFHHWRMYKMTLIEFFLLLRINQSFAPFLCFCLCRK